MLILFGFDLNNLHTNLSETVSLSNPRFFLPFLILLSSQEHTDAQVSRISLCTFFKYWPDRGINKTRGQAQWAPAFEFENTKLMTTQWS